jgi:hypothetical protein
MATTPSAPTGAAATDASEQMSDCIIASSNRYYDLLPFCNSIYYAEPQKWGCIIPWDFPQSAAREVEEEFLRKYFTETEIHMQGGAQGAGAGFRFLKQAWYSIALYNHEHRIPAIATWWLESEENSSILEDQTMRDALCNEEVKPETCFNSRDIQMYGTRMLACAVKQIQDRVKAKQALPVEEAQTAEKPRSASDGDTAVGLVNTESASVAASDPIEHNNRGIGDLSHQGPPRAASAIVPTTEIATPFPIYEEASRSRQQVRYSDHGHTAWSAGYPNHQVQGRKRGNRLSNASGGTRGGGYDRTAQEYQHRFNASMFPSNGALVDGPASFGAPFSGPAFHPSQVTGMYPNMGPPIHGVSQAPSYDNFATRTPIQHARGPNFPSGEHHAQSSATPSMFAGGTTNRGHITHRSDMERLPSDMSANSGFNNISAMSGDVRRSSFSSRGGSGLRGSNQLRGGKRGGGRGRDFSHQTPSVFEEGSYARKVSHEPYQKSNSNDGKRRGSAYHENTWRSGSEHPQVENTLPQRVLSGPHEYPVYQGFPSVAGSHLLPPFTFSPNQAGDRQGQAEHRQAPAGLDRHQHVVPDYDVDERFIGSHAIHVKELVVFNVPVHLSETEVARDFSQTCDVKVVRVRFDGNAVHGPEDTTKLAFVQLPDHNVARRVLDLREVYLYDKPLTVSVPREWHSQPSTTLMPGQPGHELNASGSSFVPGGQFPLGSYGHPRDSAPPPPFGIAAMVTNSHTHHSGMPRSAPVNFAPATPYNAFKGEQGLSTVLFSNATPANSEPNTPRKKKNKKKKAATPRATIAEHESGAPMNSSSTTTPVSTPAKNKSKKESLQDRAASNDLVEAEETTSSNIVPGTKKPKVADSGERAKDSQKSSQEPSDLPVQTSQPASEAKNSGDSPQIDEHKSDTTPTVSPRSQVPKSFSGQADVALDSKQSQGLVADNEPDVHHHSSPVSDRDRPAIVDRVSDSDQVDESFHTASASPPTEKQSQTKTVPTNGPTSPNTVRTRKSTKLSDKRSTSSQAKKVVDDTSEHVRNATVEKAIRHDSTAAPEVSSLKGKSVQSQRTPTTPLPISIEAPTPPKAKSTNGKPPRTASNRSVSEPLSSQQTPTPVEASKSHDRPAERAKDLSLEKSASITKGGKGAEHDLYQTLGAQDSASATPIPPTPMTAYHTAPTTPASLETSASKDSVEKTSGQVKTPAKKGPSQTESFSMFGKKQQKQKKTAKGKGTLKGKPLELVNASNLASESTSQNMSGTTTPSSGSASKLNKKPALTVKTETDSNAPALNTTNSKPGSTSGEVVCSEEALTTTSGQESPSKGGFRNLISDLFGRVKSPIVSGQKTSLEDVPTEDGLMESKAPAATPQTMFNIDHLVQQRTFDDERSHGNKSVFTTDINTAFNDANDPDTSGMSVTGLGISASSSADPTETPKKKGKKKKKKSKSAQRGDSQREGSLEDDDKPESIATPSTRTEATSGSFDVESDNNSDKSSTTMGQHTPPMSPPVTMTPSQRKLFEQRTTEEHLLSPRAPRNRNRKKPHNRATSSATASSTQETPATTTTGPSEIERSQQKRVMQVFRIGNDDNDDSHDTEAPPPQFIISNIVNDEGNNQQVILTLKYIIRLSNNGGRLNIYGLGNGSDDDVILADHGTGTVQEDESKDRGD